MHVCSVFCASGYGGCCDKEKDNPKSHKSCCSHNEKSEAKDCQGFHLSFFKTTGQFVDEISPDLITAQHAFVPAITSLFVHLDLNADYYDKVNNFYHPPPFKPKASIYLLDQVFRI